MPEVVQQLQILELLCWQVQRYVSALLRVWLIVFILTSVPSNILLGSIVLVDTLNILIGGNLIFRNLVSKVVHLFVEIGVRYKLFFHVFNTHGSNS